MHDTTMKKVDYSGHVVGAFFVIKKITKDWKTSWLCRCIICNTEKVIRASNLERDKSCGCQKSKLIGIGHTKHGGAKNKKASPEYSSWQSAKERCYSVNSNRYKYYGGRGIKMCQKWKSNFSSFLEDMGPRPQGCSLSRIDNNGNYEKTNCEWADTYTQNRNYSRNVIIKYNGENKCLSDWADHFGIQRGTLWNRIKIQKLDFLKAVGL